MCLCEGGVDLLNVCYTEEVACSCCSDAATQLRERAYLMYTARPTVRGVYSTEHRIDVHCDLTEVSCCLGQCRRFH